MNIVFLGDDELISIGLNSIAALNIHCDYRLSFYNHGITKSEAVNLLKNADLSEKSGSLKNTIFLYYTYKMNTEIIAFGSTKTEECTVLD